MASIVQLYNKLNREDLPMKTRAVLIFLNLVSILILAGDALYWMKIQAELDRLQAPVRFNVSQMLSQPTSTDAP